MDFKIKKIDGCRGMVERNSVVEVRMATGGTREAHRSAPMVCGSSRRRALTFDVFGTRTSCLTEFLLCLISILGHTNVRSLCAYLLQVDTSSAMAI